jgi:hypothetical protein
MMGFLRTQLALLAPRVAGRRRLLANIAAEAVKVSPIASAVRSSGDDHRVLSRHWRQNPLGDDGGLTGPARNSIIGVAPQSFPDTKQLSDQLDSIVASQFRCVTLAEEE